MESLTRREFTAVTTTALLANGSTTAATLGSRLQSAREAKGLSVDECCATLSAWRAGNISSANTPVERDQWRQWESDAVQPSDEELDDVHRLVGVTVEWLTAGERHGYGERLTCGPAWIGIRADNRYLLAAGMIRLPICPFGSTSSSTFSPVRNPALNWPSGTVIQ